MKVEISWWELAGAGQSIESLREHLREIADDWAEVPGLRLKLWIADAAHERWGALMLWESDRPAAELMPPNAAAVLIGGPPTTRFSFEVEAAVEGAHTLAVLHGLGTALTEAGTARPHPKAVASPNTTARRRITVHEYVVVDAFSRQVLAGNPVAVFFDAGDLDAATMQRIARETNLSETTFVLPPEPGADARIRIFTPVNELPFAGHPMLGTIIALCLAWHRTDLRLATAMGMIHCTMQQDGEALLARMSQPVPTWQPYEHTEALLAALGVDRSTLPVEVYHNGPRHVFVALPSISALSALRPDHKALSQFPDMAANCVAGDGRHWRARMFSPAYGVVEDAATGSAAGALSVHLARHEQLGYGEPLEILQGVEIGRPSLMLARAEGSGDRVRRVEVGGHGVVAARGTLYV